MPSSLYFEYCFFLFGIVFPPAQLGGGDACGKSGKADTDLLFVIKLPANDGPIKKCQATSVSLKPKSANATKLLATKAYPPRRLMVTCSKHACATLYDMS